MTLLAASDSSAIVAVVVVVAGFVIGSVAAAVTRRIASSHRRSEAVKASAAALATLAFSVILISALVVALGTANRTALDQLTTDTVAFLPRALSALIVFIMGNVIGALAETGIRRSLGALTPELRERVPSLVKWAIRVYAIVVAAAQLGVDTTIINIIVASLFFSIGLALSLLAALGGRAIAEQVAAGRALRKLVDPDTMIRLDGTTYTVNTVGSTNTELSSSGGDRLVPNSDLLGSTIEVLGKASDPTPRDPANS